MGFSFKSENTELLNILMWGFAKSVWKYDFKVSYYVR